MKKLTQPAIIAPMLGGAAAERACVGGLLAAVLACGPTVEEPAESHRHLAEEWCHYWTNLGGDCSATTWSEDLRRIKQEGCEASEAWDWTDECGDLNWEWVDCLRKSVPCDRWEAWALDQDNSFCQEEEDEFRNTCSFLEDHGG